MTAPIRIVIADDQELFRSGVAVTLSAQPDIDVVGQAGDGGEAVTLVAELEPDVVLMDIRMPVMDGVEATRQIFAPSSAARRSSPVRVIVLTTFNLDDRAATAIRLGASGFLLKDTSPAFLAAAIRTVHAGNAVIAPGELIALLDGSHRAAAGLSAEYLSLTAKEREVLHEIAQGLSNSEISQRIFLSESTVKTHVGNILRKLALRDRVQIVVYAYEHDLN
jgi:DNA-binding NarL/FixJ family response regulator